MPIAKRGEIWRVDLGMVAKVRPALILSVPFSENDRAVFQVVPHTTAVRNSQFEVALMIPWLEYGAFDVQGLRSIPANVLIQKLGALTPAQIVLIEQTVKVWLGIP
jgi:mRNA interferase MazF